MLHTARHERLPPGEGGIDLAAMLMALPAEAPISIELPNDLRKAAMGVPAWARLAVERTRALLASLR